MLPSKCCRFTAQPHMHYMEHSHNHLGHLAMDVLPRMMLVEYVLDNPLHKTQLEGSSQSSALFDTFS